MGKRNVLVIMADQFRWDAMRCSGAGFMDTPNFDRLAAEGVNFINAMSPNPICVPARACLTTGNYPHRCTGNKANGGRIGDDQIKIAEHFAAHGYRTYAMGKLHYVPYSKPRLLHGFQTCELCESGRILKQEADGQDLGGEDYHDYLYTVGHGGDERAHAIGNNDVHAGISAVPAEHFVDSWVATRTINHLTEHVRDRSDQPFFMFASFPKPHSPYDPPEPFHAHYDPREIPTPFGGPELLQGRSHYLSVNRTNYDWGHMSPEAIQVTRARYFGLITCQDQQIGRLLSFLDENALTEDTVVLFTADHGDLMGDFGCFFKANFLNGSVRVPFILRCPAQVPGGLTSHQLVGLQDVLPTVASLANVPLDREVDGVDLSGHLAGGEVRPYYVGQCFNDPNQNYMVFDGRYKYLYSQWGGIEELYDQHADIQELNNLAGQADHAGRVREMRDMLIHWCRDNGDDAILDGDGLKTSSIDIASTSKPMQQFMGWRHY